MLVRVAGDNILMSPPFILTPGEVDEVRFVLLEMTPGFVCEDSEGVYTLLVIKNSNSIEQFNLSGFS